MIWVFQAQRQEREGLELSMKSMRINYEEMIVELKKQISTANHEKMEALKQRFSLESTIESLETKCKTTFAEKQEYKMQYLKVR